MTEGGTASIEVQVSRIVKASRADLCVGIVGASFYSGDVALKKAHEVRDLVTALKEIGIAEDAIEFVGVHASVSSGLIGKSSSARYRVCIHLPSTEIIPDAVGVITSQKNATLGHIVWHYEGIEAIHHELLREALEKSEGRVKVVSEGVGQSVQGVQSMTEKLHDSESSSRTNWGPSEMTRSDANTMFSSVSVSPEALGLEVSHSKTVSLDVRIVYWLNPRDA